VSYKTLQELTGRESGIVVYGGTDAVLVNWVGIYGLPREFCGAVVGFGEDIPEADAEHCELGDILKGTDIRVLADFTDDELPLSGDVYRLPDDILVITPDGWC
jgi:hypothetical protein